jgi:cytochrome c nitrite reductase small subunit
MKKLLYRLRPPDIWERPVIVLLGIFAGLAIYGLYISKAWSYLGDEPPTCINCHVMIPEYANWAHNSHRRTATCNDCHVPHKNFVSKYFFKATDGLSHATKFTFRLERQNIIMKEETRSLIQQNCTRCHDKTVSKEFIKSIVPNYHNYMNDRYCLDCHREIPHGTVHGLTSTPNALTVQKTRSRVPDWLVEELRKK